MQNSLIHMSSTGEYHRRIKTAMYRTVENYRKDESKNTKTYLDLSLGVFYQAFDQRKATFETLKSFRKFYPDAPVYLISDKGLDFYDIAEAFNCRYVYSRKHTDIHQMGRLSKRRKMPRFITKRERYLEKYFKIPLWKPGSILEFLNRFKEACLYCKTEWILLLEDDVKVHDRISKYPDAHIAGATGGNHRDGTCRVDFKDSVKKILKEKWPNIELNGAGACGGSIFHAPSFLKCMENIEAFDIEFFHKLDPYIGEAADFTLACLFNFNGFTFRVWLDWCEVLGGEERLGDAAAIEHQVKIFYGQKLEKKEIQEYISSKNKIIKTF